MQWPDGHSAHPMHSVLYTFCSPEGHVLISHFIGWVEPDSNNSFMSCFSLLSDQSRMYSHHLLLHIFSSKYLPLPFRLWLIHQMGSTVITYNEFDGSLRNRQPTHTNDKWLTTMASYFRPTQTICWFDPWIMALHFEPFTKVISWVASKGSVETILCFAGFQERGDGLVSNE